VRPGQTVLDVGANWGIHTLLLSRLVGPDGQVVAVEPLPSALDELRWHVEANGLRSVTIVPVAIGPEPGMQKFTVMPAAQTGGLSATHGGAQRPPQIEVPVQTLDGLLSDLGMAPPTFLKVDIEGGEANVLLSGERLLRDAPTRPYVLVESSSSDNDLALGQLFSRHAYRLWRIQGDDWVRKSPVISQGNGLPPVWNMNTCWPDPFGVWGSLLAVPT
jgi:FkbM family methyltransferase